MTTNRRTVPVRLAVLFAGLVLALGAAGCGGDDSGGGGGETTTEETTEG